MTTSGTNGRRPSRGSSSPVVGAADLGIGSDVGVRRSLEHLPALLAAGEQVRCAATGFLEGRSGLVVATSRRLLFVYRDQTPIDVVYSDILGFRAKAGVVAAELEIEDSVGRAVIKQIHPRQRLVELAALLHKPPGYESEPTPEDRPRPSDEGSWRPKLRTKVSALPARQAAPDMKAALRAAVLSPPGRCEIETLPPPPSVVGEAQLSWRPRFGDVKQGHTATTPTLSGPARPSGPLARGRPSAGAPVGHAWMRTGEWLVAAFPEVLLLDPDHDSQSPGAAVVTNRRTVFVQDDMVIGEWLLDALEQEAGSNAPNRVGLLQGAALDFPDATTARDFSTAVRAADDLAMLPSLRAGKESK